jgi:hypothetical protein
MDYETQAQESLDNLTKEPIDLTKYLKSITETKIINVEDNIREYLKSRYKDLTTLSQLQANHFWGKPSGIKPDEAYSFDDIVKMVEENPNQKFSKSDVWVDTGLIYIITKFNRVPSISACIKNLDETFDDQNNAAPIGLNWEALDTPHYYLVEYDGKLVLCSTIGGHRGSLCVLANGYGSKMPCRVTYIGSYDIADVSQRCALIHHIDCNKRVNQDANDRLSSGVEAKDGTYIKVMQDLIYCKLYVNEDQMKSVAIKGFRKCSSWQGFKAIRKEYGLDITKYAVDMIMKNTEDEETILTQALETIASFKYNFSKRLFEINSSKDIFDDFMSDYFVMNTQSDLKSEGKSEKDVLALVDTFNKWCKKKDFGIKTNALTNRHLIKAFGDKVEVS